MGQDPSHGEMYSGELSMTTTGLPHDPSGLGFSILQDNVV